MSYAIKGIIVKVTYMNIVSNFSFTIFTVYQKYLCFFASLTVTSTEFDALFRYFNAFY